MRNQVSSPNLRPLSTGVLVCCAGFVICFPLSFLSRSKIMGKTSFLAQAELTSLAFKWRKALMQTIRRPSCSSFPSLGFSLKMLREFPCSAYSVQEYILGMLSFLVVSDILYGNKAPLSAQTLATLATLLSRLQLLRFAATLSTSVTSLTASFDCPELGQLHLLDWLHLPNLPRQTRTLLLCSPHLPYAG